jgi:hypothetical protein
MRKDRMEEAEGGEAVAGAPAPAAEMTDEELLGEATLAKLKSGEYDERDLQLEALLAAGGEAPVVATEAGAAEASTVEGEGETEPAAKVEAEAEAEAGAAEPETPGQAEDKETEGEA